MAVTTIFEPKSVVDTELINVDLATLHKHIFDVFLKAFLVINFSFPRKQVQGVSL